MPGICESGAFSASLLISRHGRHYFSGRRTALSHCLRLEALLPNLSVWRSLPSGSYHNFFVDGFPASFTAKRRFRCGVFRGWPVLSSHFSPGFAPHVGQWTTAAFRCDICFAPGLAMPTLCSLNGRRLFNCAHPRAGQLPNRNGLEVLV